MQVAVFCRFCCLRGIGFHYSGLMRTSIVMHDRQIATTTNSAHMLKKLSISISIDMLTSRQYVRVMLPSEIAGHDDMKLRIRDLHITFFVLHDETDISFGPPCNTVPNKSLRPPIIFPQIRSIVSSILCISPVTLRRLIPSQKTRLN